MAWQEEMFSDIRQDVNSILGYQKQGDILRKGHGIDNEHKLELEHRLWKRGQRRGLTPQEWYGSPVAGSAAGGPSGGAQVLGNMHDQRLNRMATQAQKTGQMMQDEKLEKRRQDMQLEGNVVSADATVKAAEIQAKPNQAGVDQKIREFETVTLPQAAKNLRLSEAQIQETLNKVETSEREFVLKTTLLKMGVENTIQTAILAKYNVKATDSAAIRNMPQDQYDSMMAELWGSGSHVKREALGIKGMFDDYKAWINKNLQKLKVPKHGKFGAKMGGKVTFGNQKANPRVNRREHHNPHY